MSSDERQQHRRRRPCLQRPRSLKPQNQLFTEPDVFHQFTLKIFVLIALS